MEIDFVEIRIVGLEEEMTVESPVNPSLRYVFLRLSQTPVPIWQSYFKESRRVSRHPHWRSAWIDRRFIVVECVPQEIETTHLSDLREDVAKANKRYREYLLQQAREEIRQQKSRLQERKHLREMKDRLKFD